MRNSYSSKLTLGKPMRPKMSQGKIPSIETFLYTGVLGRDSEMALALGVSTMEAWNTTLRCQVSMAVTSEALESLTVVAFDDLRSVDSIVSTVVAGVQ